MLIENLANLKLKNRNFILIFVSSDSFNLVKDYFVAVCMNVHSIFSKERSTVSLTNQKWHNFFGNFNPLWLKHLGIALYIQ